MTKSITSVDVDRVIHAKEVLADYKKNLLDIYAKSYSRKYKKTIQRRMDNICYIFDSIPLITEMLLEDYPTEYNNTKEFELLKEEARDFYILNKTLSYRSEQEKISLLKKKFNTESTKNLYDLLFLNFDSFSLKTTKILANSELDSISKQKIIERRRKYFEQCDSLNINPITNPIVIDNLLQKLKKIDLEVNITLIKESKFGQRKQKEISREIGISIDSNTLARLFFSDYDANCTIVDFGNNNYKNFVVIPLVKILSESPDSIDETFLHENRHAIECKGLNCGLNIRPESTYVTLNEIRTDKNAFSDMKELGRIFINSTKTDALSIYESLFPLCGNLFEEYNKTFNNWAINNNIATMERYLGPEIIEFVSMLDKAKDTQEFFRTSKTMDYPIEHYLDKVDIIKQKLRKKQSIWQKIYKK